MTSTTMRDGRLSEHEPDRRISPRAAELALVHPGADKTLADVKVLLDAGAYPNERDWHGWTPLHHTAALRLAADVSETPDIITALVAAGADPKARLESAGQGTPLHVAALMSETPDITTALLNAGSDPKARDETGRTPLHFAAMLSGRNPGIPLLVSAGADPNARDKSGETPLHIAALKSESPDIIAVLVDAGAEPNVRNESGETPLYVAALKSENPDIITALAGAGSDPNVRGKSGETPLHVALTRPSDTLGIFVGAGRCRGGSERRERKWMDPVARRGGGELAVGRCRVDPRNYRGAPQYRGGPERPG